MLAPRKAFPRKLKVHLHVTLSFRCKARKASKCDSLEFFSLPMANVVVGVVLSTNWQPTQKTFAHPMCIISFVFNTRTDEVVAGVSRGSLHMISTAPHKLKISERHAQGLVADPAVETQIYARNPNPLLIVSFHTGMWTISSDPDDGGSLRRGACGLGVIVWGKKLQVSEKSRRGSCVMFCIRVKNSCRPGRGRDLCRLLRTT